MEEQKREFPLLGWVAILAALVLGVIGIFAMLERVMPKEWEAQIWTESPSNSAYEVRMLEEDESQEKDVRAWLERTGGDGAFWLYRKDRDEYVLYLPRQDRTLELTDLSFDEETDTDGETVLVLRARTAEDSREVDPVTQLFCCRTHSERWKGIRVRVILDGREKEVHKLVSVGDAVYSTEEVYIGRDVA